MIPSNLDGPPARQRERVKARGALFEWGTRDCLDGEPILAESVNAYWPAPLGESVDPEVSVRRVDDCLTRDASRERSRSTAATIPRDDVPLEWLQGGRQVNWLETTRRRGYYFCSEKRLIIITHSPNSLSAHRPNV